MLVCSIMLCIDGGELALWNFGGLWVIGGVTNGDVGRGATVEDLMGS